MKLKDKFENVEIMFENQIGSLAYDELGEAPDECVKIAEEFAMNFAQWTRDMGYCHHHSYAHSYRELIEMYKKEQNL